MAGLDGHEIRGTDQSTYFCHSACWCIPAGYEPNAGLWHHNNSIPTSREGWYFFRFNTPT